jgi:ATP-dependent protease ClpP protease subunit
LVNRQVVTIDGEIEFGDLETFQSKTNSLNDATVVLRSSGGRLVPAIRIGETIRSKGYSTYVDEHCASACALIWLAGQPRYMSPSAQIGFHAAYNENSGQEGGMANALVGAFLTKMELSYEVVIYATVAAPDSMKWLTPADAKRLGIDVNVIDPDPALGQNTQPATKRQTLEDQALFFVSYYFSSWNTNYYQHALDELYLDLVSYYGQLTSKRAILIDKQKLLEQWPQRSYKVRPNTTDVRCGVSECSLTGVVDWEASSQTKRSVGYANFQYVLRLWPRGGAGADDKLKIAAEDGRVLQRQETDRCGSASRIFTWGCP